MRGPLKGYVQRLDEDALARELKSVGGEYLWVEDYPYADVPKRGTPWLTDAATSPLPTPLPFSGRVLCRDRELRFFDHGKRGVLLSEEPASADVTEYEADPVEVNHDRLNARLASGTTTTTWRVGLILYRDNDGLVAWTRWRVERK
jgi:hypothetical protein